MITKKRRGYWGSIRAPKLPHVSKYDNFMGMKGLNRELPEMLLATCLEGTKADDDRVVEFINEAGDPVVCCFFLFSCICPI